ncbi:Gag polyprotein [Carex littledalei]|uniref:Gag polyprotein n=1 Tax=Carex littledalei TaxID=544730 RepID=A0A833QY07_9POAL|nr:Gag polyprotein [Carex littledalei]
MKATSQATSRQTQAGEWTLVTRRKRYPDNWRTPTDINLDRVLPYRPYKKTYAQALFAASTNYVSGSNSSRSSASYKSSPANSRPSSPTTPPTPQYFCSPHSPTRLRFPPLPDYQEWWNRCFNCCRLGHTTLTCRNPKVCGKCWYVGHIASRCTSAPLNPSAPPFQPEPRQSVPSAPEPTFDELLGGYAEPSEPVMPDGRPDKIISFHERDREFYHEVNNLQRAVIMNGDKARLAMEAHQVVSMAVDTGLVRPTEIRVAKIAPARFLIHLPRGLPVVTFINKTPPYLWDEGYTFHQWSLTENTTVCMPRFKMLIDLVGIPLHLMKEAEIIKVVSKFGLFLGTLAPEHETDLSTWRVALATDDLLRIPKTVGMVSGGLEHPIIVQPVTWQRGDIYTPADFPKEPPRYTRPPSPPPVRPVSPDTYLESLPAWSHDDHLVSCSKRVLLAMCADINPDKIPLPIREAIAGPATRTNLPFDILRDLMVAVENRNTTPPQLESQGTGTIGQGCDINQIATPLATPQEEYPIQPSKTTVTPTPHRPGESRESGAQNTTESNSMKPILVSVQGTVHQLLQREQETHHSGNSAGQPHDSYNHTVPSEPAASTDPTPRTQDHQLPQQTRGRGKLVHPVSRNIFRGPPISTSRHNRFRGFISRGRGRLGSGVALPGKPRVGDSHNSHVWRLTDTLPQLTMPQTINEVPTNLQTHEEKGVQTEVTRADTKDKGKSHTQEEDSSSHLPMKGLQLGQTLGLSLNKRKSPLPLQLPTGPMQLPKRPIHQGEGPQAKQDTGAYLILSPEGFREAQISEQHGQAIAAQCGVTTEDIFQTLAQDNAERKSAQLTDREADSDTDLDDINKRFEPDTDDDLGSRED